MTLSIVNNSNQKAAGSSPASGLFFIVADNIYLIGPGPGYAPSSILSDWNIKGDPSPLVSFVCSVTCIVCSFTFCTIHLSISYTMDFNQRMVTLQHVKILEIDQ